MTMNNTIIHQGKYLIKFKRWIGKKNNVYYKAFLYEKPIRLDDPSYPKIITTVSSYNSFNSKYMRNKYNMYGHDIICLLLYTCKLLYLSERKYFNIDIPILEVNPNEYSQLNKYQRVRLGYNLSKIIKTLYYDEFRWKKCKYIYFDHSKNKNVISKLITFKRIGVELYK